MIKRIIAAAAAAALSIACASGVMAASSSSVTISGAAGKAPVSFLYSEDNGEIVKSVKHLFSNLSKLTGKNSITESLVVQSISASNEPVTFSLRLSLPAQTGTVSTGPAQVTPSPSPDDNSVLDYYNITITDIDGDTVYDYRRADKTSADAQYKDIALNTLNTTVPTEREAYKITVSANSDLSKLSASAQRIDWSIVVNGEQKVNPSATPSATPNPDETDSPVESDENTDVLPVTAAPQTTTPEPVPSAEPVISTIAPQTAPPAATTAPASTGKLILTSGRYTVGNEIAAGRYEITGDSNVRVYTTEGDLKTNIILTTDKKSREGVNSYILTVRAGETIEVTADTTFEEYIPARATSTPRPTSTPRATARPTATSTPRATTPPKDNPQTGDNAPIALAAVIGIAALAIVAVLEVYKRKNR